MTDCRDSHVLIELLGLPRAGEPQGKTLTDSGLT